MPPKEGNKLPALDRKERSERGGGGGGRQTDRQTDRQRQRDTETKKKKKKKKMEGVKYSEKGPEMTTRIKRPTRHRNGP